MTWFFASCGQRAGCDAHRISLASLLITRPRSRMTRSAARSNHQMAGPIARSVSISRDYSGQTIICDRRSTKRTNRHHAAALAMWSRPSSRSSPATLRIPKTAWFAWLNGKWVRIPPEKIVPDYAPDGQAYLVHAAHAIGPVHFAARFTTETSSALCDRRVGCDARPAHSPRCYSCPRCARVGDRRTPADERWRTDRRSAMMAAFATRPIILVTARVCRADLNLRTWLVVKRIVGDHALVEVDLERRRLLD